MLTHNVFPLREWHLEHMQKTVVKFVTGLSEIHPDGKRDKIKNITIYFVFNED